MVISEQGMGVESKKILKQGPCFSVFSREKHDHSPLRGYTTTIITAHTTGLHMGQVPAPGPATNAPKQL